MTSIDRDELANATAITTARWIADGRLSSREATDAAIARIEAKDDVINAVVVRDFDRARAAADAADAARNKGERKPLLGVPMTVKESNDIAGLPTTWGFPDFKALPVRQDAVAVARLKAAGAVILGKTNVPVSLGDWQSVNPVYGRTNNPHNLTRSAGGSSGGGAAAVASGMVPLEFGSDIGGSIRVPAVFCGVFGHKPSYGVIPLRGHGFPGTDGAPVELAVVGPLARDAADLALALDVTAGPDEGEAAGWKIDLAPPRHAKLAGYRVTILSEHPSAQVQSPIREALETLARKLDGLGASVSYSAADLPDLASAQANYIEMLGAILSRGGPPRGAPVSAHRYMELVDERYRLMRAWRGVFAHTDVVLAPAFGTVAFPHTDEPEWGKRSLEIDGQATPYGAQIAWAGVATYPGLPGTAVPIGKTKEGLPIGIQIIGPYLGDRTTLAFAALLEREGLTV